MDTFAEFIEILDSFLWGAPLLLLLAGCHLFLSFRLKFIQRFLPMGIRLSFRRDPGARGDISHFGALMIALAATIGTGNVLGVTTAVVYGGPGAVFWCWLCGVFGIATRYAETVLAVKYRVVGRDGMVCGGAMYVIERGMYCKWLAVLFAVFTLFACFGIGCMVQSNTVASFTVRILPVPAWSVGLAEMVLFSAIIFGGLAGIAKVCNVLVPVMAAGYILSCFVLIGINHQTLFPALKLIVTEAFSLRAVSGGFFGSVIMLAMRYGIARGLFSNESGMGSAPLVAASARSANPVRQALIASTAVFWDTVCICALTGLVIVSSALKINPAPDFSKFSVVELAGLAFANIPVIGRYILIFTLVTFGYTSILGWFCYGRQAALYFPGKKVFFCYRMIFILLIFAGSVLKLDLVWNISDIANGLMAVPNIISLFCLSGVIVSETRKYLWSGKIDEIDPECAMIHEEKQIPSE